MLAAAAVGQLILVLVDLVVAVMEILLIHQDHLDRQGAYQNQVQVEAAQVESRRVAERSGRQTVDQQEGLVRKGEGYYYQEEEGWLTLRSGEICVLQGFQDVVR